jgi:hypothetical protein
LWLYSPADGRPQEKDLEVAPRQAARHAPARGAAREHLPPVRAAQAAAPDVPELQDLRRARDRAAPHPGSVGTLADDVNRLDRSFQTDTQAKPARPEDGIASDAVGP